MSSCLTPKFPKTWYTRALIYNDLSRIVVGIINVEGQVFRLLKPFGLSLLLLRNPNIIHTSNELPTAYPVLPAQWNQYWSSYGLKEKWLELASAPVCDGIWDAVTNRCFYPLSTAILKPPESATSINLNTNTHVLTVNVPDYDFSVTPEDFSYSFPNDIERSTYPYLFYIMNGGRDTLKFLTSGDEVWGAWDSHGILGLVDSNSRPISFNNQQRVSLSNMILDFNQLNPVEQAYIISNRNAIAQSKLHDSVNPVHISHQELLDRVLYLLGSKERQERALLYLGENRNSFFHDSKNTGVAPNLLFPITGTYAHNYTSNILACRCQSDKKHSIVEF